MAIKTIYNEKDCFDKRSEKTKNKFKTLILKDWQKKIADIILCEEEDERTIYWVVDKKGKQGKSALISYFEENYPNDVVRMNGCLTPTNCGDTLRCEMMKNKSMKYILVDIPRACQIEDGFYEILETIKNGSFSCTKYKCQLLRFDSPVLIVFSNNEPNIYKLSGDRWKIYNLTEGQLSPLAAGG